MPALDPAIFDSLNAGLWIIDAEYRTTYVNAHMAALLGCTLADVQGRTLLSFIPADAQAEARQSLARCLQDGGHSFDVTFRRHDGSALVASVSASPVKGEVNDRPGFACVVVDVGDRRRAEDALRRSAAYYRVLTSAAQDHIFVISDEGRVEYVNQAAAEQLRSTPDKIIGKMRTEIFPPDVGERQATNLRKVLTEGKPLYVEARTLYLDREVWLSTWLAPIPDDTGKVTAVLGLSRDLTDRKRVEDELRAAEQRLRVVLSNLPLLVWATNRDGRATFCAGQALPMLGVTAEDVVGRTFEEVGAAPFTGLTEHAQRALQGKPFSSHIDVQDLTFEAWSVPLRDEKQTITGATGVVVDITERRRLETELLNSQKMEAIGRLAGGIAHDFNNNLTSIIGYVDMILGQIGDDKAISQDLKEVQRAAERAAGLVKRLLAFGRRQVVQPRTLDLNAIVEGLKPMLDRLIGEHTQIVVTPAPDLQPVTGDAGQLEQVIMNLALNARDAMPSGGVMTIETSNVTDRKRLPASVTGPRVLLTIRDTGTGMDAGTKEHLFEPFFTTKPVGEGAGLGLSTVYAIVKQLGGSIWVESQLGQGSAFQIFLPVAGQVPATAPAARKTGAPAIGRATILLVEDEDAVRRFAKFALERHGYRVIEAASPDQALALVADSDEPIDLLLTDVVMPHLSGPEMAERLVLMRPGLPVLYMSGYPAGVVMHGALLDSSVRLLSKPFTTAELLATIQDILGKEES